VNRSWKGSEERVSRTQNTRAAVEFMVRDIRMAGTGFSGARLVTGGLSGNELYPLHPTPGLGGTADTLHIIGSFEGVQTSTTVALANPGDIMQVGDGSGFEDGDLIVITNGSEANLFQVTSDPGMTNVLIRSVTSPYNASSAHAQWPAAGYPAGSIVAQVDRISYWVDQSGPSPRLMKRINDDTAVPVAYRVDDLRIDYELLDGTQTPNPLDPSLISSVVLRYVATAGSTGDTDTLSIQVQPRVMG
jgi:hypothetical protein